MADRMRPEQLLIAAASAYALQWPITPEHRDVIREVLSEALSGCGKTDDPSLERVIIAAGRVLANAGHQDGADLRLALGNFFYRRMQGGGRHAK